ncbi:ATP-binding cassette domain-containing protein [Sphingomonadales bacterium 56]|uniref:ATP-binding cassette domain-containing protein n=1 Tax=unclassified Sphingobium TaxID=2611147 RepID=UPI001919A812|nr:MULTISPECIES: ATP-binding cassette domain-containing protein [unclassified Sphingobium]MBY2929744.1 ATP-binding cassette domain-containing protein [Sphingomonadales bacterium 56]MBY2960073.1 ATP-binding cassette domain-containing protein [Sphingomonadales bacterium 58]CAD7340086.1 Maltose/maltodextrin import ATP-binding protein MalK [Sphingobium sp. S6]CAD7340338.1 Maltose/maltodextrin import ATP-binding protein MalK [Sphingobium sp. S8]
MSFDVDVRKTLGDHVVAARFVASDGITLLWGPSGVGKTSVLNMIAGLMRPDQGHVSIDGQMLFDDSAAIDLPPHRRRIGYVFQDGRLFPHLRVRANLLYGHRLAAPENRWMSLQAVIDFLGIEHLLGRWPGTLSGGEAQRVAIGRALLSGARALLMDEPLASIDPARREGIMDVILRIRDELALPIVYVTHNAVEADRLATRKIELMPSSR